mmetsp:Transcript_3895/g.8220  ORF Transcript_3895/g.8220 Transcript_3895/m.8220 type:complete len:201 (-) Transcript_3895:519-1121(-)
MRACLRLRLLARRRTANRAARLRLSSGACVRPSLYMLVIVALLMRLSLPLSSCTRLSSFLATLLHVQKGPLPPPPPSRRPLTALNQDALYEALRTHVAPRLTSSRCTASWVTSKPSRRLRHAKNCEKRTRAVFSNTAREAWSHRDRPISARKSQQTPHACLPALKKKQHRQESTAERERFHERDSAAAEAPDWVMSTSGA